MSEPIRKRGKVDFPRVLLRATIATHVLLIIPYAELFRRAGVPHEWPLGAALALVMMAPIRGRIRAVIWDEPRPGWKVTLLDEPYFIHWCATFFGAPFLLLGYLVAALIDGVQGRLPTPPGGPALAFYLGMLAMGFYSIKVRRRWVLRRHFEVPIEGLDPAFDGFRIAQLSDLHIGGMLPPGLAERWVRMANDEAPDLTVITGDLVTSGVNFHDRIAAVLGGLQAREGVVVSMGNHDYFGEPESLPQKLLAAGLRVPRNASLFIERGGAQLRISAVDDTWTARADLEKTLGGPKPAPTVLLAHDPNLFDRAAELGADLVLSGHTHAGQVTVAKLHELSIGRIAGHKYVHGLYGDRSTTGAVYVGAGVGAAIIPLRVGERGRREVTLFELGAAVGSFDEHHTEQRPLPGRKPSKRTVARRARLGGNKPA